MTDNEFDLIDRYFAAIGYVSDAVAVGPGDDCAVLSPTPGYQLCVSTDSLVSGVHFPVGAPGDVVAGRAFGAAMSDLAAMGARPLGMTVALVFPEVDHSWLQAFADTLAEKSSRHETPLVGGNLARGPLSVTVTVIGETYAGAAICRSGARPGDRLYVSGHPGEAAAALALEGQASVELRRAYEQPLPQLKLGQRLAGIASAAIDISDGLLADAEHLAAASHVELQLNCQAVPLSDALVMAVGEGPALRYALTGGDDYELLFTLPEAMVEQLPMVAGDVLLTCIGVAAEGNGVSLTGKVPADITATGWRHF